MFTSIFQAVRHLMCLIDSTSVMHNNYAQQYYYYYNIVMSLAISIINYLGIIIIYHIPYIKVIKLYFMHPAHLFGSASVVILSSRKQGNCKHNIMSSCNFTTVMLHGSRSEVQSGVQEENFKYTKSFGFYM